MKRMSIELPYHWYAEVEIDDDSTSTSWIRANVAERMHKIVSSNRYMFENLDYLFEIKPGIRIVSASYYDISIHDFDIYKICE